MCQTALINPDVYGNRDPVGFRIQHSLVLLERSHMILLFCPQWIGSFTFAVDVCMPIRIDVSNEHDKRLRSMAAYPLRIKGKNWV